MTDPTTLLASPDGSGDALQFGDGSSGGFEAIKDDSGYFPSLHDLKFLDLSAQDLTDMTKHQRPLGMSLEHYTFFCNGIRHALKREGVASADVRLKGSAANFFSSPHKLMPYKLE